MGYRQVVYNAGYTIISCQDAVVMPLDHNSLMEAIYLIKSPVNAAHLAKSIAQY